MAQRNHCFQLFSVLLKTSGAYIHVAKLAFDDLKRFFILTDACFELARLQRYVLGQSTGLTSVLSGETRIYVVN